MNAQERNEKIEAYGRGFQYLEAAVAQIPREAWNYKPSPEDWSVHEIIVHMGDSESMAALRLRKLIAEPGSTLMAYEEARWAQALNYLEQNPEDSLQIIKYARQTTYRLLKTIPETVIHNSLIHPEMSDPYTLDTWLGIYARHIPDHVDQMQRAFDAWKRR